jgi:hypothetical protein
LKTPVVVRRATRHEVLGNLNSSERTNRRYKV